MPISTSPGRQGNRLISHKAERPTVVTFNQPPHHFFEEQTSIELDDLTRAMQHDHTGRVVICTGTGAT